MVNWHHHNADLEPVFHGGHAGPCLTAPTPEHDLECFLRERGMKHTEHGIGVPEDYEEILHVVWVNEEGPRLNTETTLHIGLDVSRLRLQSHGHPR